MITFTILYWFISLIDGILNAIFHPIKTITGSFWFKVIGYMFLFTIILCIACFIIGIFLFTIFIDLIIELIKYIIRKKKEKDLTNTVS